MILSVVRRIDNPFIPSLLTATGGAIGDKKHEGDDMADEADGSEKPTTITPSSLPLET